MKIPHWPIYTGPNKDFLTTVPRVKYILSQLGNPHLKLQNIIHITGTKGKGSTALFISNILIASGYKVNTYISPHIYECNERILLNGQPVTDAQLQEATEAVRLICEKHQTTTQQFDLLANEPSMFEALTCSAFHVMSQNNADFNVIEVGMGGLYDATNVFDDNPPLICVFTPIHIDHVKFLGNNVENVAWQKSFLIKPNVRYVVMSSQPQEVQHLLLQVAQQNHVPTTLRYAKDYEVFCDNTNNTPVYESTTLDTCFPFAVPNMQGEYQWINASCAITTCLLLQNDGIINNLTTTSINQGIHNTFNIVRMQPVPYGTLTKILPTGSLFYMDGAHNQLAAHALANWIQNFKQTHNTSDNTYTIYLAVARTKGADNIAFLQEFKQDNNNIIDVLIATRANLESIPEPPESIALCGKALGFTTAIAYNITEVLQKVVYYHQVSNPTNRILLICTGSLYIARDIMMANKSA